MTGLLEGQYWMKQLTYRLCCAIAFFICLDLQFEKAMVDQKDVKNVWFGKENAWTSLVLETGQVWIKRLSLLKTLVELRRNLTPWVRTVGKTLSGHSLEAPGVKPKTSLTKSKHSFERKVAGKLKPPGCLAGKRMPREILSQIQPRGHRGCCSHDPRRPGCIQSDSQIRCHPYLLLLQMYKYKSGNIGGAFTKVLESSEARWRKAGLASVPGSP